MRASTQVPDQEPDRHVTGAGAHTEGRKRTTVRRHTQGGSRMRESRTYGFVRGALSNERPYRARLKGDSVCAPALRALPTRNNGRDIDVVAIATRGHGTQERAYGPSQTGVNALMAHPTNVET